MGVRIPVRISTAPYGEQIVTNLPAIPRVGDAIRLELPPLKGAQEVQEVDWVLDEHLRLEYVLIRTGYPK